MESMYRIEKEQLVVEQPSQVADGTPYQRSFKQLLDVCLIVVAAPIIVPLVAVAAFAVRVSGGPAFYRHERVGFRGQRFQCLKLRTMVPDADAALKSHLRSNPAAAEEWLKSWKLENDPRVTPLGRFLRRTSLDELPQLLNVLRGEMALVGPRPITGAELAQYGSAAADYAQVRPGITGLWQVAGRNALSPEERMRMDQTYSNNVSFGTDLLILWRTVGAVWRGGQ